MFEVTATGDQLLLILLFVLYGCAAFNIGHTIGINKKIKLSNEKISKH